MQPLLLHQLPFETIRTNYLYFPRIVVKCMTFELICGSTDKLIFWFSYIFNNPNIFSFTDQQVVAVVYQLSKVII